MSALGIPAALLSIRIQWASFLIIGKRGERVITVSTDISNGNNFIHLLYPLTVWLENRPRSYSINWVNSLPRNWKNQFPTCADGLTDKLKYQLRKLTCAWFAAPTYPVLFGSARPTGIRVLVWYRRNKFCATLILRQNISAQPTARFYLLPTDPPPPIHASGSSGMRDAREVNGGRTYAWTMDGLQMDMAYSYPEHVWCRHNGRRSTNIGV